MAKGVRAATGRARVGLWFGLLLLFVPIFYPLLYFKRYSPFARVGWGVWLGLIVFVKIMGLSEPIIDIKSIEEELEQGERNASSRETFITQREAPPLIAYLRRLEGGFLGIYVDAFEEEGRTLRVRFKRQDGYFDSEKSIALNSVGAAFSLLYGRDYDTVTLDFDYRGSPLRVSVQRAEFNHFFGLGEAEMRALAEDRDKFEASRLKNIPEAEQEAFFQEFARYR